MAFNTDLPVEHSLISSQELRDQFNGLKELHDQLGDQLNDLQYQLNTLAADLSDTHITPAQVQIQIENNSAPLLTSVFELTVEFNDPPIVADVNTLKDKLNELIGALQR